MDVTNSLKRMMMDCLLLFFSIQAVQRMVESVLRRVEDKKPGGTLDLPLEDGPTLRHLFHRCGSDVQPAPGASRLRGCLEREAEGVIDAVLQLVFKECGEESTEGHNKRHEIADWKKVMKVVAQSVATTGTDTVEVCDSLPALPFTKKVADSVKWRLHHYFGTKRKRQRQKGADRQGGGGGDDGDDDSDEELGEGNDSD